MGSRISIQKTPESEKNFQSQIDSKKPINLTNKQPVKEEGPIVQNLGSKEESFFDSQAWLESDCDDDFLSVNGDLTPARNSTSNNPIGTTQVPKAILLDGTLESKGEPFPIEKKKRLSELFEESFMGNDLSDFDKQNKPNTKAEVREPEPNSPPEITKRSPFSRLNSLCSSERSPHRHSKRAKEKWLKSPQCCLPMLQTSRSFNGRKMRLSP